MLKKILVVSVLTLLFLPFVVFGAVSYSRTPSSYTIENPVEFLIWGKEGSPPFSYWGLFLTDMANNEIFADECYPPEIYEGSFTMNLPSGEYKIVRMTGYTDETCLVDNPMTWMILEYDYENPIFEVIEEEPEPEGIFTIGGAEIGGIMDYSGKLFTDLEILIILAIGLPIGFFVIFQIIRIPKTEKSERKFDWFSKKDKDKLVKKDWL